MRLLSFLLLASLLLNALFGAVHLLRRSGAVEREVPADVASTNVSKDSTPSGGTASEAWAKLGNGSDADLVARLRAGGFPPEVIRTIVAERLNERFAERRKTLSAPPLKYWQRFDTVQHLTPEQMAGRRAVDREYRAAMEALLGDDAYPKSDAAGRREFGDLPPAKIAQIKAINHDYAEMTRAVREAARGVKLPEDEAKYAFLEEEKRTDLAAALTPDEMLAYELRSSGTAHGLRGQLRVFEPSEAEFVALFHVQREVERELAALGRKPTADEAREIREAKVEAVLSPERFEEYHVKTAGGYNETVTFVDFHQLPPSAVGDILRTQRDTRREVQAIEANVSLTAEQRQARLAAVGAQARAKLEATMGPHALGEYLKFRGQWLAQLPPPPPGQP